MARNVAHHHTSYFTTHCTARNECTFFSAWGDPSFIGAPRGKKRALPSNHVPKDGIVTWQQVARRVTVVLIILKIDVSSYLWSHCPSASAHLVSIWHHEWAISVTTIRQRPVWLKWWRLGASWSTGSDNGGVGEAVVGGDWHCTLFEWTPWNRTSASFGPVATDRRRHNRPTSTFSWLLSLSVRPERESYDIIIG